MRVHKKFKENIEKIRESNKNLSSVEITELITRHNSFNIIKEDLKEYEK